MTLLCYTKEKLSSDYIAGSLNTNPALVRKALRDLISHGLVVSKEGKNGGYQLSRSAEKISLAEIYGAVKPGAVLGTAKNVPNPQCPVGRQISGHLNVLYQDIETYLDKQLAGESLKGFCSKFN